MTEPFDQALYDAVMAEAPAAHGTKRYAYEWAANTAARIAATRQPMPSDEELGDALSNYICPHCGGECHDLGRTYADTQCTGACHHPLITTREDAPTVRPLVITIPLDRNLPPELSPNHRSRSHWPRTRALAAAREEARLETLQARDPDTTYDALTLHVVIARTGRAQELDDDNAWASLKGHRDGIADALGIDDRNIRQGTLQQVKSDTGSAYLRIAMEAA